MALDPSRPYTSSVTMFDPSVVIYPLLLFILIFVFVGRRKKHTLPYPPGPKGYPILGNVLDLPVSVPIWENFVSLANNHGTPNAVLCPGDSEAVPQKTRTFCTCG